MIGVAGFAGHRSTEREERDRHRERERNRDSRNHRGSCDHRGMKVLGDILMLRDRKREGEQEFCLKVYPYC